VCIVKEEDSSFVVLLTATIQPKTTYLLQRVDPIERLRDYEEALRLWLKYDFPIVFCENSNYDLSSLRAIVPEGKDVEFIQFEGTNYSPELGKGIGEWEVIVHALTHTKHENPYFIKVSGRYFVKNIKKIIKRVKEESLINSSLSKNLSFSDSRCFVCKKEFFYDYFNENQKKYINDSEGVFFEHVLAKSILKAQSKHRGSWSHLAIAPNIIGISGTDGARYSNNFIFKILKNLVYFFRKRVIEF